MSQFIISSVFSGKQLPILKINWLISNGFTEFDQTTKSILTPPKVEKILDNHVWPQCYTQWVYKAMLSFRLKIILVQNIFQKNLNFFLQKWAKKKNSFSKMWFIEQLYIELG